MVHPPLPRTDRRGVHLASPAGWEGFLTRQGLGLYTASIALLLMCWGLGRPALWLDESASAVATQRSWPHLWELLRGTDAPLVPYYALLKAQKSVVAQFFPATSQPEVLLRWPSAIAIALATWALVSWLRSVASPLVAVSSGAALLLIEGVSRYGQEARPYALVLMTAILTTIVWWWLMSTVRPAAMVAYAVCAAALVCLHALAASLVLAHLLAALLIRRDERLLRVLMNICGALAGLLVATPLTMAAVVQGGGAARFQRLTATHLLNAFASLFDGTQHLDARSVIMLVLAAAGLTRWNSLRYGDLTRVAAAWAIAPALVFIPAVAIRPNLLLARYLMFVVPGWAVLAGLGISTVAAALARSITAGRSSARACSWVIVLTVVAALTAIQWPALAAVRTPAGHGENIRPALALIDASPYRSLPIAITSRYTTIEVGAYTPADAPRVINFRPQTDQPDIWPQAVARPQVKEALRSTTTVLLLTRSSRCGALPAYLNGYQVAATNLTAGDWVVYLLRAVFPAPAVRLRSLAIRPVLPCPT